MGDWLTPDNVFRAIGIVVAAMAAYFAIKSDLRAMHEKITAVNDRVTKVESDVTNIIFGGERRHHTEVMKK